LVHDEQAAAAAEAIVGLVDIAMMLGS